MSTTKTAKSHGDWIADLEKDETNISRQIAQLENQLNEARTMLVRTQGAILVLRKMQEDDK